MKKKLITGLLALLAAALLMTSVSAAGYGASVVLDGNTLGVKAQVKGHSVYLPVRAICEGLGYDVTWSEKDGVQTAVISNGGDNVTLNLTRHEITDNGHTFAAVADAGSGIAVISGRVYLDSDLLSSVLPVRASFDVKNNQVIIDKLCENNVTVTTEKLTADKEHLKTTIQYPQLSGLADADVQKDINEVLKKSAQNALNQGVKNADEMAQAIKDGYTGAVGMCETYYDYKIAYNQNGLISVVVTDYQYAGGAHGSTVQSAFTFDLSSGKPLQLGDLMESGAGYTAYINEAIRKEIDRRVASGSLNEFDFAPFKDIGENPEFYLSGSGIVFYFQQYAYFPYAAGIQEFTVSYQDLSAMLKDEFRFLYAAPVEMNPMTDNKLFVGDIGQVVLQGNASTGYAWHFVISDSSVLTLTSECASGAAPKGIVGAGGTYTWNFKALKAGDATVTFKYYREWEGESSATPENTLVYLVTVT